MSIRKKPPLRKRPTQRKIALGVDPSRLATAAMERIRTVLLRAGHGDRIGAPITPLEILARADLLGQPLPPSYAAAMRMVGTIGDPERFLTSNEMRDAIADLSRNKPTREAERYVPFVQLADRYLCFDTEEVAPAGELPIVEWVHGSPRPRYRNFGELLDGVADLREESLEHAAVIPPRLRTILLDLGFRFDYPVVGRLETGDTAAIRELLGNVLAREIMGDAGRLFDSSGKASLTLNVDEFTLAVSLRTGIFIFEAEDVFRWLRHFRDENFFGDTAKEPSHPDQVRDLRKAPREPPLVLRGTSEVQGLPAREHQFRGATGKSADDFHLLGRTGGVSERSSSLILHVVKGKVQDAHAVDEPLNGLHVTPDGTIWGLSMAGTAIRFIDGNAKTFPLLRPTRGRSWWYGIGGDGDRVLVWGAGALLVWDGDAFSPFYPDAGLDDAESVPALVCHKAEIAMLVCGDRMGAVARFDGRKWIPIGETQVIEGALADLDVWRGVAVVLTRDGHVFRSEDGAPRPVDWDEGQQAFLNEAGGRRPTHALRCFDGGALLASDGGVIAVGAGEPIFHAAPQSREQARLVRVGGASGMSLRQGTQTPSDVPDSGIVALVGPHVWMWREGAFQVVDVHEW